MALSTLLEIINRAEDGLGLPRSSAVAASSNPQARQLFAAANSVGRDLMRSHEWGALQTLGTITTADGTSTYALASDFDRMISDTGWDRTNDRFMVGPDTVQINRYLNESGIVGGGMNKRFRLQGSNIVIWPTPSAVETLVYEYISNKWALSSGSTAQTEFLADTDTSYFDPDLLKAEIKWRFMSAKGMYSEALYMEAMQIRAQRIAFDIGGSKLDMTHEPLIGLGEPNLADASWDLS